jgi:cytochrome c553
MKIKMKKVIKLFGFLVFSLVLAVSCEKENENENEGGNETKTSTANSSESHNMGQNCMNCHKQGGQGEGWFTVAGTVYDTSTTKVYPGATIKLFTGPNGTGTLKYTLPVDKLGNFYTTNSVDFISGLYPAVTGSNATRYMSSTISNGQCNSCHGSSTSKITAQ